MDQIKKISSWTKLSRRKLPENSSLLTGCDQAETRSQDSLIANEVHTAGADAQTQKRTKSYEDESRIIQEGAQNLPKPQADPPGNLQQELLTLQQAVSNDLNRLGPLLKNQKSMGTLVECYHSRIFSILDDLLQKINDTHRLFILLNWVQQSYLSLEMFGQLHCQEVDVIKKMDLLLLTEWVTKAKTKLLENGKKEFRDSAQNILEIDKRHIDYSNEEACVGFYVDIIQLTEAMPTSAERISSTLAAEVRHVSFRELLSFLQRYSDEQTETLKKKTQMDERELIYFLKTLKTCTEIKQYVRSNLTKMNKATKHLLPNIIEVLENVEAITLTCVRKIMINTAESFLKSYFTAKNKEFFHLINIVQNCFPKKKWCQDELERVMVEVYRIIVHMYMKQLVKVWPKKLTKLWSRDVGQTVAEDAEILHNAISEMVPVVEPLKEIMLKATELMKCNDPDVVLLITALMHAECLKLGEQLDLQMALQRWKGLPARKARKVLEGIPDCCTSRSVFWNCCLPFCQQSRRSSVVFVHCD